MSKFVAILAALVVTACQTTQLDQPGAQISEFPAAARPAPDSRTLFVHWRHSNADQDIFQSDSPLGFDICHDRTAPSSSVYDLVVKVQRSCGSPVDTVKISKGACVHLTAVSVWMPNAENQSEGLDKEAWIRYTASTFPNLSDETFRWQYTGRYDPNPINGTLGRTPWRLCKDVKTEVINFRVTEGACGVRRASTASCVDIMASGVFMPSEWNPNLAIGTNGDYTAGRN